MKINGMSLFSGGGIGEMNLSNTNVKIVVANELIPYRCDFYKFYNPKVDMVCGDITNKSIKKKLIDKAKKANVDFVMITPPCQGASLIGKNKNINAMRNDFRNYLIFDAVEIVEAIRPSFVFIENVTRFYDMFYTYGNSNNAFLIEILHKKFGDDYYISYDVYHCEDYKIPQARKRGIIRMWKKNCKWESPSKHKPVTVREAIGKLPSLESGGKSKIKNHFARVHTKEHIVCMQHTPTGHSAYENKVFYPKTKNGTRVKGFSATFKRMSWDEPAPTITMRNDCISSQCNVHPGRKMKNGLYSDARVLTMRELLILSSIDPNIDFPPGISESQARYIIGEGVPPRLSEVIIKGISYGKN